MRIISIDTLKAERRALAEVPVRGAFLARGMREPEVVESKIVNGEMEVLDLARPIGEMLTSADTQKELLRKVVLDVELGRQEVPILYKPIYDLISDRNFPETFEAKWAQYGVVVFVEHMEGEEVKFGSLAVEQGPIASLKTWAAGFEYTEDMVEYNQTFNMEVLNRAFGEAFNALLNHIHLYPIISYAYAAGNQTAADATGATAIEKMRNTLRAAIKAAATAGRPGNVLLCHSSRVDDIREGLARQVISGSELPAVGGIDTIIAYDGWSIKVGRNDYSYAGVATNKAYLIRPKRGFKELVKHDLIVDSSSGDLTRLIESQVVGRARRGTFASIPENVQEIGLPA